MNDINIEQDGRIMRGDKQLGTSKDGELVWNHYKFKDKYDKDVRALLGMPEDEPKSPEIPKGKSKKPGKEPNRSIELGDRTPGYPEWYLEEHGADAYRDRYFVRGAWRAEAIDE